MDTFSARQVEDGSNLPKTIIEAKEHHFIEPRNIVLSGNEKIDRAMLRLERKRIRTEKEERALLAAVELTRDVASSTVKGAFDALANGFTAVGQIGRGVAENPDPIAQGVSLAGAAASIVWLAFILEGNPYTKPIGDFLQLDKLLAGFTGLASNAQAAITNVAKTVSDGVSSIIDNISHGRDPGSFRVGEGKYCFHIDLVKGPLQSTLFSVVTFGNPDPLALLAKFGPHGDVCFNNRSDRDTAVKKLTDTMGLFSAFYSITITDQDPVQTSLGRGTGGGQ